MRRLLDRGNPFDIDWPGQIIPAAIFLFIAGVPTAESKDSFDQEVLPFLKSYCLKCHHDETAESGIRLDQLTGTPEPRELRLWEGIRRQIIDLKMPPEDEPQPANTERAALTAWIDQAIRTIRSRPDKRNGSIRRLTVSQYRNTLQDLLGLREDITQSLPPDAVSKDGFTNNTQSMQLTPLQVETYLEIAEQALDRCIVDETVKPMIQSFRVDLGKHVNSAPYPDALILGANSALLENTDFVVSQPIPQKQFDFDPLQMQTVFRFVEGYEGNSTVRGWRDYDSIYHAVFACVRGAEGYPRGMAWETVPEGLLLRPAIPGQGLFGVDSTYGHKANFKISLRELPTGGDFRVTVSAAKYDDGLLLETGAASQRKSNENSVVISNPATRNRIIIEHSGIYQVDAYAKDSSAVTVPQITLTCGTLSFSGQLHQPAFLVLRLPAGKTNISVQSDGISLDRIILTPLSETTDLAQRFIAFEQRSPKIGVHMGLRRDCGSTLAAVGVAQTVDGTKPAEFVFEGAINNFPKPSVEKDNVNYLAGIREIGVRSEYTDGRDIPRLLIRSVLFEGPFYESWPPAVHRRIFPETQLPADSPERAREIIRRFATNAYRRPLTGVEETSLFAAWRKAFESTGNFRLSIRNTLYVVLTSPQFLFLVERSETPEPEPLNAWELAAKLSYFLWNTAPDERLLQIAAEDQLHESLDTEVDRMISHDRFEQSMQQFVAQWLDLNRFDVIEVDHKRFPQLTPHVRTQLRREPVELLQYLIRENLPLHQLIRSDFVLANEVVADYYGLSEQVETGFDFVRVRHGKNGLGGVLTQAAILAGLSDGRESNPVKRGAWLARRIIAEPPADPPPNVPELPIDQSGLSMRERLKYHSSQKECAGCHARIDPWGLAFEQYDAGGLSREDSVVSHTTLPDGTDISDTTGLKSYLVEDRIDQVAFSLLKNLAGYAVGRTLTYNEIEFLRAHALELKPQGYLMRDMVRFVINSDLFLMK
ncbi:MAG: DUF1592 domain-containing protein [Fuerstiella sp.]|nr:DUF1592 domain-containing protein [Fuerstiella sp.]